jgi:hypothetical protein
MGTNLLCEGTGESCKECLGATVGREHGRWHETCKGAEVEDQTTFPVSVYINTVQATCSLDYLPLNHTREDCMRDADRRIHVDSDNVSVLLFLRLRKVRWHGVRFADVVNYVVSRVRLRILFRTYREHQRQGCRGEPSIPHIWTCRPERSR